MYIRSKPRKLVDNQTVVLDFVLAKSIKSEDGKYKQQFIQHLGSIKLHDAKQPHILRSFYERVEAVLQAGGFDDADIHKMTVTLRFKLGDKPDDV
ncbi:hypothetical protein R4Z09_10790 [Niallia oryzisoli]|uniref:Uncharacterized protein n=1 Tax=Niallia oryzisoli TaxID=1737571 RepID=A0ABZ2CNW5_9BACI